MIKITILLVVATIALSHSASLISRPKCPTVQVQKDFNLNSYFGLWYEVEKYPIIWEVGAKCITATYTAGENNTDVSVYNRQIGIFTGIEQTISGYAKVVDDGKLSVTFPTGIAGNRDAPYWVLETDYVNYSVVWACSDGGLIKLPSNLWILTRERIPSEDILNKARAVLDKNNLSRKLLSKTNQKNC